MYGVYQVDADALCAGCQHEDKHKRIVGEIVDGFLPCGAANPTIDALVENAAIVKVILARLVILDHLIEQLPR